MPTANQMRFVDVNVLVDAHRPDGSRHDAVRAWLDAARVEPEPLGVPRLVASEFLRIVTHPRVFREPTPTDIALRFLDALYASPAVVPIEPEARHWPIFTGLVAEMELRGNDILDAYLAALAIEQGATFVTSDRGFARFPGIRLARPVTG